MASARSVCCGYSACKWPGLFHGTERNGTERNWGLKYGTERIRNDRIGIGGLATHGDSSTALVQLHCKLLRS